MDDWLKLKSEFQRHVRFKPVNSRFKSNKESNKKGLQSRTRRPCFDESDRSNKSDEAEKCLEGSEKCDETEKCKGSEECGERPNGDRSEECPKESPKDETLRTNNATNDHRRLKDRHKSAKVLSSGKRDDLLTKSDYYLLMLLIDSVKQSNAFCEFFYEIL